MNNETRLHNVVCNIIYHKQIEGEEGDNDSIVIIYGRFVRKMKHASSVQQFDLLGQETVSRAYYYDY
jgi:hypothetical protein